VTTNDLPNGRSAATRLPGYLRILCAGLLCACALPALADEASPATASTTASTASTGAATTLPAAASLAVQPRTTEALPLVDRSALFSGDINRMLGAAPVAPTAPVPATGRIQSVLQKALALLGTPYRWGGTTTSGFDCSGLVGYVFRTALGIELPRVSREMATSGTPVARESLTPGDLVFFGVHHGRKVDHVGIYMGEGRFLHAPRTGRDVTVSSLEDGYWSGKFLSARRVSGI
jgi:cell wall-associated NlpC family hydrolase